MDTVPPRALFQQEISFADTPQAEKECSKCHARKPVSDFPKRSDRNMSASSRCRQCVAAPKEKECSRCHEIKPKSEFVKANKNSQVDKETCVQCLAVIIEQKECSKCHQVKPVSDFTKRKGRKVGYASRCKQCLRETHPYRPYVPGKYPTKPDHSRNSKLRRNYGITIEEYDAMLVSQEGVCKVCGGPSMGKGRYHVDHDHITGKVRGLLCHKCNVALGMVQDDVAHLKSLIAYLEETS